MVVLYGLPGSGKTLLANRLKEKLNDIVIHIEFDFLESCFESVYKRKVSYKDRFYFKSDERKKLRFDKKRQERFREISFDLIGKIIDDISEECKDKKVYFVIDDNNILKGQRKRYKKIARGRLFGYCEVFCNITIEQCITNNEIRDFDLPNKYIIQANKDLEVSKENNHIELGSKYDIHSLLNNIDKKCTESYLLFKKDLIERETEEKNKLILIEEGLRKEIGKFIKNNIASCKDKKGLSKLVNKQKQIYREQLNQQISQTKSVEESIKDFRDSLEKLNIDPLR